MTVFANTLAGGANGATITIGGDGGGDAFTDLNISANGSLTYSNDVTRGSHPVVAKSVSGALTAQGYVGFAPPGPEYWWRMYIYSPAASAVAIRCISGTLAGTRQVSYTLRNPKDVQMRGFSDTALGDTVAVVPDDTWCRLEGHVIHGSPGAATCSVSLYYTNSEGLTADETITANSVDLGGTPDTLRYGITSSSTNQTIYFSAIALSTSAALGPEVVAAGSVKAGRIVHI